MVTDDFEDRTDHCSHLELTQSSCTVGDETLKLLQILKQEKLSSGQVFAAGNLLQKTIKLLTRQAEVKRVF